MKAHFQNYTTDQIRRFIFRLVLNFFVVNVEINKYRYVLKLDPKMLDICIVDTLTSANRVSGQPGREYIQLLKTELAVSKVENIFSF